MEPSKRILGIEGGGTKTDWVLLDGGSPSGAVLAQGMLPASNLRLISDDALARLFSVLPADATHVGAFLAGCGTDEDRARLQRVARRAWPTAKLALGSDRDSGMAAAFGDDDGIIVIAGTGAAVHGRKGSRVEKAGGWGHVLGDRGGGYNLAVQGLRLVLTHYDLNQKITPLAEEILQTLGLNRLSDLVGWAMEADKMSVARLAPAIFHAAKYGEPEMLSTVQAGADILTDFTRAVAQRLEYTRPRVKLLGGLFTHHESYVALYSYRLSIALPDARVEVCHTSGALGAAWLAERATEIADCGLRIADLPPTHSTPTPPPSRTTSEAVTEPHAASDNERIADCGLRIADLPSTHSTPAPPPSRIASDARAESRAASNNPQSPIRNPQFESAASDNPQSAIRNPQSEDLARLAFAPTEQPNPRSGNLEKRSTADLVELFISEEDSVTAALQSCRDSIIAAADLVSAAMQAGGRLFYIGAGTSGRLGVLDASEIPPTFGAPPELVQGIIAGGAPALHRAVEGAEDQPEAGAMAILDRGVRRGDIVCGIASSGRTPFVLGGLSRARALGADAMLLSCNPAHAPSVPAWDAEIHLPTGPEIITGSTRLKAGTATKIVLNLLSTIAMIRLGRIRGSAMVDLQITNAKLRDRGTRLVSQSLGVPYSEARARLERAGWNVRACLESLPPYERSCEKPH